jgi:hypothetical protein
MVLAAVWGIVALWAAGRRRGVVVAAGLAVAVIVAVPVLRERFSELALAAVGVPPERGWAWLGTGRVAIWTRSFAAWVALPVDQVLLGTGLAGYGAFWKEKEPHSELLATLYQLGPLGLGALCWAWAAGWREAWRARGAEGVRAHAAIALGGWAALLVASAVGSTLLIRLTLSWTAWGLLAGALALTRPDRRPPPGRVGSAGATPVAAAEGGTPTRRDGSPAPG